MNVVDLFIAIIARFVKVPPQPYMIWGRIFAFENADLR